MTRILTPTGYRDVVSLNVGDEVSAFDAITGASIVNQIETIEWVDAAEWARWHTNAVLPPFTFYRINGRWTLNSEQSIWRNGDGVCHVKHLVVGDVIYDDADQPVTITSIAPIITDGWWRFDISGDHSYIADGLTLHNASRFWVGGTGTWDLATTTHWASSTNGAGGQTAPGSADTVTIDANSGSGTITPSFGGTGTFQSIACGTMGMTLDFTVNNNDVTLVQQGNGQPFNGSGTGVRTINLGNGKWTITNASGNIQTPWTISTSTNCTFNANLSTIEFTGVQTKDSGRGCSMSGGNFAYNKVKISGAHYEGINLGGITTLDTLEVTASAAGTYISISTVMTLNNLIISGQLTLSIVGTTLTLTSAPTLIGTSSAPHLLLGVNNATTTDATISLASGTMTGRWCFVSGLTLAGGGSFVFTDSYDLGKNAQTNVTFSPPKYVSRSRAQSMAEAA